MLSHDEARRLVLERFPRTELRPVGGGPGEILHSVQVTIVDSATIEKSYGWLFFYQSEEFVRAGDPRRMIVGNGPVVVNKFSGEIRSFGSSGWETALAEYEAQVRGSGSSS